MSTSVVRCYQCYKFNFAGVEKCEFCGGEVEPSFRQLYNYYLLHYPEIELIGKEKARQDEIIKTEGNNERY